MAKINIKVTETADCDTYIITNRLSGNDIWVEKERVDTDLAEAFEAVLNGEMDPNDLQITVNEAKYLHSIRVTKDPFEFEAAVNMKCWGCQDPIPAGEAHARRNNHAMCALCINLADAEIAQNYRVYTRSWRNR